MSCCVRTALATRSYLSRAPRALPAENRDAEPASYNASDLLPRATRVGQQSSATSPVYTHNNYTLHARLYSKLFSPPTRRPAKAAHYSHEATAPKPSFATTPAQPIGQERLQCI